VYLLYNRLSKLFINKPKMETTADIQHAIDNDQIEINPRTGQPYKTSPAARKAKAKWAKKNPEVARACVYRWIDNNRGRFNEICRESQRRTREELYYFRELFTEALV
jgi:hypothetical protein